MADGVDGGDGPGPPDDEEVLQQYTPVPYQSLDPSGTVLTVNRAWLELLGYDRSAVVGESFGEFLAPDSRKRFRDRFERFKAEGGVTGVEFTLLPADGDPIEVAFDGRIEYEDGDPVRTHCQFRDMTHRRDQQRRLEHYRQAVESSSDLLAAVDTDHRYYFANDAYRRQYEISREADLQGTQLEAVLDPATVETIEPRLERAADGETVEFEMTRTGPGGEDRIFDIKYFPLEATDGSIRGIGASMRDITAERERTEAIRHLSEHRRVISAVNHWLVRADSKSELLPKVVDLLASSDLFGCTVLALIEDDQTDFICTSESDLDRATVEDFHTRAYVEEVFESGMVQIEDVTQPPYKQHQADVESHPGVGIAIAHEGAQLGVLSVHFPPGEDLEEVEFRLLKQLADDLGLFLHSQSLEQELETFREIAERIDDPIMLQDLDGRFEVVNPALAAYADIGREALRGLDETAFMDESTARTIQEKKERVVEAERPLRYEVSPTLPGKGERVFSTVRYPHYDDGELDGTVAICRDVTDLKERERQLQVMDRVLRHNVNNNMTVVEGYAETIRETSSDEIAAAYADRIIDNSETLISTVKKEREISKILADPPRKEQIDLVRLVTAAVEGVRSDYPEATVVTELPERCEVQATEALGQAIEELIENAAMHSDRLEPSIAVGIEETEDQVQVTVSDQGPGIPEMEQRVLTGSAEIEPLYHGSGLGLWLVNLIVQHSDGVLSFDENDPRGSVVTIALSRT